MAKGPIPTSIIQMAQQFAQQVSGAVLAKQQTEHDRKIDKIDRRLQKMEEDF